MDKNKQEPKLNIIVTPEGLERVSILGGVDLTLKAMRLYQTIAANVLEIDKRIKKNFQNKHEKNN